MNKIKKCDQNKVFDPFKKFQNIVSTKSIRMVSIFHWTKKICIIFDDHRLIGHK